MNGLPDAIFEMLLMENYQTKSQNYDFLSANF